MHSIIFDNTYNDWNEALPTGNGVFGGMVYFKDRFYTTAMNHYEVYYSIHEQYVRSNGCEPQRSYESYVRSAKEMTRNCEKEAFWHYRKTIWPDADEVKDAQLNAGVSHPPTGEFSVLLDEKFKLEDDFRLQLNIEKAEIELYAKDKERALSIATKTLVSKDVILTTICQSDTDIVSALEITYPIRRNRQGYAYRFFQSDPETFGYRASFYPGNREDGKTPPFQFCVFLRLIGAEAKMEVSGNKMCLCLKNPGKEISVLTHVLTELQSCDLEEEGIRNCALIKRNLKKDLEIHEKHWKMFFQKGGIRLPDRFLEKLWYLNLYVMGCCSGKGGRRSEHACGLNGLWDIRQPTLWGSMWYWDVNIQSAFWGVYTANHMELAEAFNEGLLAYAEMARRRAEEFYHLDGCAMDYPHEFYNCILPWCAQHLWWYYEYTLDETFLREKAYPFFRDILCFVKGIVRLDPEKNTYYIFPDVSPEQGPITRNSTITLAAVKYLLKISIWANEILGESKEDRAMFSELLSRWPKYPLSKTRRYGVILRDSELAPPEMKLRHPSLLMPVFPAGEMTQYSQETEREIARNSVRFASENTEIGVFPFGWIASAAARAGDGNTALRVLYEQGLDLVLRANGMGAEETDRWVNHCPAELGMGQLYYPCMMESVGGIVSAVNEMLLQSHDGVIHVFPAVPDGGGEPWRDKHRQKPLAEREEKSSVRWEDCSISRLLAKGGFEVSADMRGGRMVTLQIRSLFGGTLRIEVREPVAAVAVRGEPREFFLEKDNCLTVETKPGETYDILFADTKPCVQEEQSYHTDISYVSHLGRRVFCGKDRYTDTVKMIDSFLFDYYMANDRYHNMTIYKFSFGVPKNEMRRIEGRTLYAPQMKIEKEFFKLTGDMEYCTEQGIGFLGNQTEAKDTGRGNVLLQDFVSGSKRNAFLVELPKGIYEFLVVSGGSGRDTLTRIKSQDESGTVIQTKRDGYETGVFMVVHKNGGVIRLDIETEADGLWNLNLMVIKKLTAFM